MYEASKLNLEYFFHNDRANVRNTILLTLKEKTSQPVKINDLSSLD